jgi:protein tyrosine phosphatase (PTP) superfamily phosphohydrolase (DUF442 family)
MRYILCILFLSLSLYGQTSPNHQTNIKNFGQLDERFYRGAQPSKKDYQSLKSLGIDTVIDLEDKPTDYEQKIVESLGMHYINIPVKDKTAPTPEMVHTFLNAVNSSTTGKFFVHCAGGRHRTGDMAAVYRVEKYHWNFDMIYQEMKNYDFYTSYGHESQKQFVLDYINHLKNQ